MVHSSPYSVQHGVSDAVVWLVWDVVWEVVGEDVADAVFWVMPEAIVWRMDVNHPNLGCFISEAGLIRGAA